MERRGCPESFGFAKMKVAFECDNGILWPHDPSGKFTATERCIKGWNNMIFHLKQFRGLKIPLKYALLCRQPPKESFLWRRTCLKGETFSQLVGVQCVFQRNRRLTTFSSGVVVSQICGIWHYHLLARIQNEVSDLRLRFRFSARYDKIVLIRQLHCGYRSRKRRLA